MNPLHAPTAAFLMVGRVMHERLRPTPHRFVYPLFCVRLNLARLATLERWWFRVDRWGVLGISTRDYGACDGSDLEQWIRQRLADADIPAYGEIWLQTMPRVFGYAFNPVSFWFCHDREGQLRALLAEVRNTFGDRHSYLLTAADRGPIGDDTYLQCRKTLHVSPFCKVEGRYEFRVRQHDDQASVAIDYYDSEGLLIRTAIGAKMAPLTGRRALRALVRQPLLTVSVVVRIHWQALRLLLKKVPFYGKHPHPTPTAHVVPNACPRTPSNKETRS